MSKLILKSLATLLVALGYSACDNPHEDLYGPPVVYDQPEPGDSTQQNGQEPTGDSTN